jgi:hypothetical protein
VVADATHQSIAAHDLAGGLVEQEPRRLPDVVFGALALCKLEGRFTDLVLDAWRDGRSSLLGPFEAVGPAPGRTSVHVPADDPRRPSV